MPDTRIELLGGFSAVVDGTPVPDGAWRLRKARELVKLLALTPQHRLHREQAMDTFWREKGSRPSVSSVRSTAFRPGRAWLGRASRR